MLSSKQKSQDIADKSVENDWKVGTLQPLGGKLLENNLTVVQFHKNNNLKVVKRYQQALPGSEVIWRTRLLTEAVTVAELEFGNRKITKLDIATRLPGNQICFSWRLEVDPCAGAWL